MASLPAEVGGILVIRVINERRDEKALVTVPPPSSEMKRTVNEIPFPERSLERRRT